MNPAEALIHLHEQGLHLAVLDGRLIASRRPTPEEQALVDEHRECLLFIAGPIETIEWEAMVASAEQDYRWNYYWCRGCGATLAQAEQGPTGSRCPLCGTSKPERMHTHPRRKPQRKAA